jgi:hypothetical protein
MNFSSEVVCDIRLLFIIKFFYWGLVIILGTIDVYDVRKLDFFSYHT